MFYLYLRYSYIPTPYSIYENIKKLPAATFVEFNYLSKELSEPKNYWDLMNMSMYKFENRHKENNDFLINELDLRIKDSIKLRMISDVPIGAFLSGGIDSSLIAAQMQSLSSTPINTFTIGFDIDEYNEAFHAKRIAKYLKTNHVEHYVSSKETMEIIPFLSNAWDEPFADSSQIPTLLISKIAQNHVSVILSGDGGDEIFCGYNRYNEGFNLFRKLSKLPFPLRYKVSEILKTLPTKYIDSILTKIPLLSNYPGLGLKFQKISNILQQKNNTDYYKNLISTEYKPSRFLLQGKEPKTILSNIEDWPKVSMFQELMMIMDIMTYLQR